MADYLYASIAQSVTSALVALRKHDYFHAGSWCSHASDSASDVRDADARARARKLTEFISYHCYITMVDDLEALRANQKKSRGRRSRG